MACTAGRRTFPALPMACARLRRRQRPASAQRCAAALLNNRAVSRRPPRTHHDGVLVVLRQQLDGPDKHLRRGGRRGARSAPGWTALRARMAAPMTPALPQRPRQAAHIEALVERQLRVQRLNRVAAPAVHLHLHQLQLVLEQPLRRGPVAWAIGRQSPRGSAPPAADRTAPRGSNGCMRVPPPAPAPATRLVPLLLG